MAESREGYPSICLGPRQPRRWRAAALITAALFATTCLPGAGAGGAADPQVVSVAGKADEFLVVDCLLPGQIRQLGRITYLTARRPVKTSARDCQIRGGEYLAFDRANYATALKVWLEPAKKGDPAAQTYVGEIFEKGLGTTPDYAAAAEWYRRAAESDYSRAAINLGTLYEQGLGVPKDPRQALNWYRRAAGLGNLTFEIPAAAEVKRLEKEVGELRRELQASQAELDRTQRELEKLRRSLEQRRSEADAERRELAPLRQELEERQRKEQTTAAGLRDLERAVVEREAHLAAKEREVGDLRASVARLESESGSLRAELTRIRKKASEAGPEIRLIEPELVATRGTPSARLPAGADSVLVIGRVEAAAGLKSLMVNSREETLDSDNLFKARVPVKAREEPVRIVAIDREARKAALEFVILRAEPPPAVASRSPGVGHLLPPDSFGTYHGLVIGNDEYRLLPRLQTAVNDATDVARVLRERYAFKVTLLRNATRYDVMKALNELRERLTDKDNLLIYYAGHGDLEKRNQRGHWLPVDAEPNSTANWISNIDITDILNAMSVKQLLVVADSCYSGALTRGAMGRLEPGMSEEEYARVMRLLALQRSRMVMTSGGLEPVLDSAGGRHSIFAQSFLELLQANVGVLAGQEMFQLLLPKVALVASRIEFRQVPEYAPIKFAGHESGDFLFVRTTN